MKKENVTIEKPAKDSALAVTIQKFCERWGLCNSQFAQIADFSAISVTNWLSGKTSPTPKNRLRLKYNMERYAQERESGVTDTWKTLENEEITPNELKALDAFGKELKRRREALGYFTQDLAALARANWPFLRRWEEGAFYPRNNHRILILNALVWLEKEKTGHSEPIPAEVCFPARHPKS